MKREFSAGGIVYDRNKEELKFLLVKNQSLFDQTINYWGFPKGHIEEGENSEGAALREVEEETGIKAEIVDKIGYSKYVYFSPKKQDKVFKVVTIFFNEILIWEITSPRHRSFRIRLVFSRRS